MTGSELRETFTFVEDLVKYQDVPPDGILTRALLDAAHLKAVMFTFSRGQQLSEHTASVPAIMHFLAGTAEVTLCGQKRTAGPGTWVHMPAGLTHSVTAQTPVVMLLLLIKGGPGG